MRSKLSIIVIAFVKVSSVSVMCMSPLNLHRLSLPQKLLVNFEIVSKLVLKRSEVKWFRPLLNPCCDGIPGVAASRQS